VRNLLAALAVLAGALLIAWVASQPPAPLRADAPAGAFSAERAMADVRAISRAPRPTGSAENAWVRSYLATRMRGLGMMVEEQAGPLPARSAEKLRERGNLKVAPTTAVNLIGLLPGRDPRQPALLLMAHYDSVPASPGAPDDAAGVAAALEIVRALSARGAPLRNVAILFTDAEEAGLTGAEMFFKEHPLARRIGAAVNMESRGGGGRTAMFETGRGNGAMMEVYRASVSRPSANSLAVLIYELMPNNTDFTIPKERGIAGFNFAFIGRAELYHSPMATADRFDPATLQDLGGQALAVAGALAFAPALPPGADDAVFGDLLGLFVIAYPPAVGWLVLGLSAALFAFAWSRVRRDPSASARDVLGGAGFALAFLLHTALLLRVMNLLSGSGGDTNYYDRLAALPRLELQALLLCLAALLIAAVVRSPARRLLAAAPALSLTLFGIIVGGWSVFLFGIGLAAALAALLVPKGGIARWSGWFGLAVPVALLAIAAQVAAPTATPLLAWPLLLAAAAAAIGAAVDPELRRPAALVPVALLAILGSSQLLYLAHFTFLGVGAPTPDAMAIYALLVTLLVWPLVKAAAVPRLFVMAAGLLAILGAGLALSVRLDPMAPTIPPYSEPR
jgi:hypothetical protein